MTVEHNHGDGGKIGHKYLIKLWPDHDRENPFVTIASLERIGPELNCKFCPATKKVLNHWWRLYQWGGGDYFYWRLDILRPFESSFDRDAQVETIEEFILRQPVLV